jgi:hypothetical protein
MEPCLGELSGRELKQVTLCGHKMAGASPATTRRCSELAGGEIKHPLRAPLLEGTLLKKSLIISTKQSQFVEWWVSRQRSIVFPKFAKGEFSIQVTSTWVTLLTSCLIPVLLFFTFPVHALASTGVMNHALASPTMQVNAGFATRYRDGNWVPVQVALHNDGPDFSGAISINVSAYNSPYIVTGNNPGTAGPPSHYQVPITLANGAQKQITTYIPIYYDTQSIIVRLLDGNGHVVSTQDGALNPLNIGDMLIGVLSDQSSGFGSLSAVTLPSQGSSLIVEFLNANTMPDIAAALKNFNVLVLDNFTTSSLSANQLTALQNWVDQGGALIEVGGPEWRRTLSTLPKSLLPVAINGTTSLPAGSPLLPLGGPSSGHQGQTGVPDTAPSSVTVSTATLQANVSKSEIVFASGTTPLITQTQQGQGTVSYLAYDPTLEPIVGWAGASTLWKSLLFRTLGDQLLSNANSYLGPGYFGGSGPSFLASRMSGLLQMLQPNSIPSPWTLALLLVGYVLVLGPIRLLFVKSGGKLTPLQRRDWSWRIVLCSIIVFSGLTYGLAIEEKGTSITSNSVTVAQLNEDGAPAHLTTYLGVFAPNQGDLQVYVPGVGLVQPSPDTYYSFGPPVPSNQPPTTIMPINGGTNVTLQNVEFDTLHSIVSEQDRPVQHGLVSNLVINNGTLVGTVTNTLGYTLSDAYLLMPDTVLKLGQLAAGQTKQVMLPLNNIATGTGLTLADQIVQSSGVPNPYSVYPFGPGSRPLSEVQRHLLILLALDGRGYYFYPGVRPVKPIVPILLPPPVNSAPGASISVSTGSSVTITSSVPSINNLPAVSFAGGPYIPMTDDNDPLLIHGAAATLIGWAANPLDSTKNVMINDISPTGLHETLVQAPLPVNLSGPLNLPPYFLRGHLIDAEGNNVQVQFPGIYAMTTGSMTFEFAVPDLANLQVSGLTIIEPPNAFQPGLGTVAANGNPLPLRLYNWHTNSWDSIVLKSSSFSTKNVADYIGPRGSVLLQLANQNTALGTLIFSTPSLNLQGVAVGT